ncbi:MAG: DUF4870 domain-containing protein [Actinomycetia bacterium]|nr:DUF4870 domain-containing protein [Actinomycetes bacterium]
MRAVIAQVSGLVGLALIGPLVIMLVCADQRPFAKTHATEALNFHITVLFGVLISLVLVFVFFLGVFTMIEIGIAALVYSILAAVAASKSETFRYPLTLRLVT